MIEPLIIHTGKIRVGLIRFLRQRAEKFEGANSETGGVFRREGVGRGVRREVDKMLGSCRVHFYVHGRGMLVDETTT